MKIVITGAGGFVGNKLARVLYELNDNIELVLMDLSFAGSKPLADVAEKPAPIKRIRYVEGSLQNAHIRAQMLKEGVDVLYHLAAVPGGAAENDPALSRAINLDATLSLFEEAAQAGNKPRVVYSSTIAVLGTGLGAVVDDDTPVKPEMVYGAHKAMIELALADFHRRHQLDVVTVRLPGIVARPPLKSGLKSAFMSNVFHTLKAGHSFISPVSESATFWMMSVRQCVQNLSYGAQMDSSRMPDARVVTLPAVHCDMRSLCAEIGRQAGVAPSLVSYDPDPDLEAHFGRYPRLNADAAVTAGFSHDGCLEGLVNSVLESI